MNSLIINQITILCIFAATGLCIGILFDFFRILRKSFKTCDIITYIEDILFWIISGIMLVFTILKYTDGGIRIYMILGLIVGIVIYFCIISKIIRFIFTYIFNCIKCIFTIFILPFKKIYKIIKKRLEK